MAENKKNQNDYVGAINAYSRAISMKPDYSYAYNNRGFLKYQLKILEVLYQIIQQL